MHIWLDPNLYQQESHSRHISSTGSHHYDENFETDPDSPTNLFRNALIHDHPSNRNGDGDCDCDCDCDCDHIYATYRKATISSYALPVNNSHLDEDCEPDHAHRPYRWINLSPYTHSMNSFDLIADCEPDADCNIRHSHRKVAISPHALRKYLMSTWNHELHCSPDLYLVPCDNTHWLACNPIQQGIVAVLDEEARDLLETFRTVRSLKSLAKQWITEIEYTHHAQQPRLSRPQMIMLFLDLGFLVDICQDKNNIPALPPYKSHTLSAWLHVTNACNMGCSYCYISKSTEHMTDDVGTRSVDTVIRSALHYDYQRVHLKYAGGEALLRWPQILTIHDYAVQQAQQHDLQLSATVLSNGTTLTPRIIQQLRQRHINVMISLDGIGSDHDTQRPLLNGKGSFSLAQRAITCLLEHNLVPHINITVSQRNLAGLPNLVAYLLEYNLPFSFSYYRDNDCSTMLDLQFSEEQMIAGMKTVFAYIQNHLSPRKIYSSLMDRANLAAPHHYTCNAGRDYLVIDQHGGITKCQTEIHNTITTIHADDPLSKLRSYQQGPQVVDVDNKEGCCTCNWRYWCGGGCAVVTYRFTGRNDIRSPNCSIYKALFPEALRLEALRLLKYTSPL